MKIFCCNKHLKKTVFLLNDNSMKQKLFYNQATLNDKKD